MSGQKPAPRQADKIFNTDLGEIPQEGIKTTLATEDGKRDVLVTPAGPQPFAADRDSWERQPEETDFEWHLFILWRDLEPRRRTYREVHRLHNGLPEGTDLSNSSVRYIQETSQKWRWRDRVNDYDRHIDEKIREELEGRRMQARLQTADLGREMKQKALIAVQSLESVITVEEGGELVLRSRLSPSEIGTLARIGAELESAALGDGAVHGGTMFAVQVNVGDTTLTEKARKILEEQDEVVKMTEQVIDVEPSE